MVATKRPPLNDPETQWRLARMITESARWMQNLRWERGDNNFEMAFALCDAAGRVASRKG